VSGKVSGKLSRQLPRHLPRHLPRRVSGKLSGQLQEQVSWDPRKPPENPKFGCFPGTWETELPDGRSKGLGSSRSSIPYSIYISQFQTGTPKPRYIGFRAGGRENGTRNGQFRPVFGHILWPLSRPSIFMKFHEIRALERVWSRFLESRSRTSPGRVPDGCLGRVSGAASQELLQTASQTPSLEGCLEGCLERSRQFLPVCQVDCSRLLQTGSRLGLAVWSLPPTRLHLAQVRVAKLASLLKPSQVAMACHGKLGWVEQTCQASQQVEVVRWGKVVRLA
jgi:hypothetical protein